MKILDDIAAKLTPHAETFKVHAQGYMEHLIQRLDILIELNQHVPFNAVQKRYGGVVTAGSTQELSDQVGSNDDWRLLKIVAMAAGGAQSSIRVDDGQGVIYAQTFTGDMTDSGEEYGIIAHGGSVVKVSAGAADVTYVLVFELRVREQPRPTQNAGLLEPGPVGPVSPEGPEYSTPALPNTARHGPNHPLSGYNLIGEGTRNGKG